MEYLVPKKPDEAVSFLVDWSRQIGADAIGEYTFTVTQGTVTVVASETRNFGSFLRIVISGGADGETAIIRNVVTTLEGQTFTRDLSLLVAGDVTAVTPTTTTKRTIVNMAFEEIGLAGYEFDATPEEQFSALRRLDALMAEWRSTSLDIGYNFPAAIGTGDLDDVSNIPDTALNAVVTSLALRICPAIGKTLSVESRQAYAQAMSALRTAYAIPVERALPRSTPRGIGNKPWSVWQPFGPTGTA